MLAHLYHLHHITYDEDIPFWQGLAERYGSPILELGCGTGRVLLRLAEVGYPVWGIDDDPDMLGVLNQWLEEGDYPNVEVREADLTTFQLPLRFPLIILPCNTYSTLSKEERRSTLKCVTRHLSPGGAFVPSLPNPEWLDHLPEEADPEVETIIAHPTSGNPVQVSSGWRRKEDEVIVEWHYDHLSPDGRVERISTRVRHNLTTYDEYVEEMEGLGFNVKAYGDFNSAPYVSDSMVLILEGVAGLGQAH